MKQSSQFLTNIDKNFAKINLGGFTRYQEVLTSLILFQLFHEVIQLKVFNLVLFLFHSTLVLF